MFDTILKAIGQGSFLRALPSPLRRPGAGKGVSVGLRGYMQRDGYSCGYVAALSVLHTLRPWPGILRGLESAQRLWRQLRPDPDTGVSESNLIRCLRRNGIRVGRRKNLRFSEIKSEIDAGNPVITTVKTAAPGVDHWTVVHGYGIRPSRVYISNTAVVTGLGQVQAWADFKNRLWGEKGHGLVCSPAKIKRGKSK